jgi:hypothetical protein
MDPFHLLALEAQAESRGLARRARRVSPEGWHACAPRQP